MLRYIAAFVLVVSASACSNAPAGAFPSIVSVRTLTGAHFCGGTILNSNNILTAAHCIVGRSTANTDVLAGTNNLNSGGITRGASRFIIHANYNQNTLAHNIAVIRLSSALAIGGNVQQVSLNTDNTGAIPVILVGWGRTAPNSGIPNNLLQQLYTQTLTHAQCVQSWGNSVTSLQICVVIEYGCGVCNGDSGGPLYLSSNRAQLGVASFGGCASGRPDIHVRVSSYIDWIESVANS